jgi:hypothetical protein
VALQEHQELAVPQEQVDLQDLPELQEHQVQADRQEPPAQVDLQDLRELLV